VTTARLQAALDDVLTQADEARQAAIAAGGGDTPEGRRLFRQALDLCDKAECIEKLIAATKSRELETRPAVAPESRA